MSSTSAYGIRAMAYLAAQPSRRRCGSREIAEREQIPHAFLWKILHLLRNRGLVRSAPGIGGGYCLALLPSQIRLIEIVGALEDLSELSRCALRIQSCPSAGVCRLHSCLQPVRDHFLKVLENTTLDELLKGGAGKGNAAGPNAFVSAC